MYQISGNSLWPFWNGYIISDPFKILQRVAGDHQRSERSQRSICNHLVPATSTRNVLGPTNSTNSLISVQIFVSMSPFPKKTWKDVWRYFSRICFKHFLGSKHPDLNLHFKKTGILGSKTPLFEILNGYGSSLDSFEAQLTSKLGFGTMSFPTNNICISYILGKIRGFDVPKFVDPCLRSLNQSTGKPNLRDVAVDRWWRGGGGDVS